MKRILYLGYWNLDDPLTKSTIFPNLRVLKSFENVKELHFLNTQREKPSERLQNELQELGVKYYPINSKNIRPSLLNKILDFLIFPGKINKYCSTQRIDYIIARGAPAGVLAAMVARRLKIPFLVESYEPHADYMRYSNTWGKFDPRYIFQKKWEKKVKSSAKYLLTVSENYRNQLVEEGLDGSKVKVVPCVVDQSKFFPKLEMKAEMRDKLNVPQNAIVGVYAGKFGNLYYDKEAFKLFKEAYESLDNFYLLLLSNEKDEFISQRFNEYRIPHERLIKRFVKHSEMPNFLNVADFAFATIRNIDVSKFQSPVKTGEYWACGLPILLSKGVGDESDFIEKEKGGILIDNYSKDTLTKVIDNLNKLLKSNVDPLHYVKIASKYRNFDQIEFTYKSILYNG